MTQTHFLSLIGPFQDRMFRLAFSFLRDEDEAKDIVQDSLVKIWEKRELLPQVENLEAWCIRITKNTILDKLKYNSHRKIYDMKGHEQRFADTGTRELAETKDALYSIQKLISSMPEKQRFFIHLRDVEGFAYSEIAQIMDLSIYEVKIGIFRARKALRENFKKLNSYGL